MKHSILLNDVENRGGYTCMGIGNIIKLIFLSILCNPKTALKYKQIYLKCNWSLVGEKESIIVSGSS